MRSRKKLLSCLAVASAIGAIAAPSASGATTIGNGCIATTTQEGTVTQLAQVTSSLPLTAPADGVITKWGSSVIPYPGGLSLKLKVMRPTGAPNTFQVVGETGLEPLVSGTNSYPARVPIKAGDRLGLSGAAESEVGATACGGGAPGDVIGQAAGDQGLNSTSAYTEVPSGSVPVTGTIEPDVDKDGFGDETQDLCPQSAALQIACPVLTLDALALPPGKGSVRILVAVSSEASIKVSATAKVGGKKSKKAKASATAKLTPITQLLTPGKITSYTLNFNKALKDALASLPKTKTVKLEVTAEGKSIAGATSSDKLTVKLKGHAKP